MSGFDPDAYLASKAGFDPDAYLRAKAPPPGMAETAVDHFAHGGTLGFSDEIYGAGKAMGDKLTDLGRPEGLGELYRKARDQRRGELASEKKANPWTAGAADIAGGLVPMALPGMGAAAKTAGGAATIGGALAAGRGLGDAQGTPNPAAIIQDAALGAGLGKLGYEAGAAAAPAAAWLRDKAIEQGRRVLMAGKQSLTRGRVGVSPGAVQEALDAGAILPGGTSKGTLERITPELEQAGQRYGDTVTSLKQHGVESFKPQDEAMQLAQAASGLPLQNTSPRADMMRSVARDLGVESFNPATGRMPIDRGEAIRQELDKIAKSEFDKLRHVQSVRGQTAEEMANRVRASTEQAIEQQAHLAPDAVAQFVPVKQQYGRLAEATNALREGIGQAQRRSGPNLTDTIIGATMAPHGLGRGWLAKQAHSVWRERGPSTMSWLADALSEGAGKVGPGLTSRVGWAGDEELAALIEALRKGDSP